MTSENKADDETKLYDLVVELVHKLQMWSLTLSDHATWGSWVAIMSLGPKYWIDAGHNEVRYKK